MDEQPKHISADGARITMNPFLSEPVVQTPRRMHRRENIANCPFCLDITTERWPAGQETWIRPNDFPALQPPLGECVILLYTRQHDLTFADLTLSQVADVVDIWQQVYNDLSSRFACVMTFENAGVAIGQTQAHPHGQAYGVSFLPSLIAREMAQVEATHAQDGSCLFCRILTEERSHQRIVINTPHWVGFVPLWSRYPYEVHLYARTHVANIGALPRGTDEVKELSAALLSIVRAYNTIYQAPMPYMLALHQLADPRYHLHIELLPVGRAPEKLKFAASSESAFGLWLNDADPNMKAAELRAQIETQQ